MELFMVCGTIFDAVCTRNNILVGVCGLFVSDVISEVVFV